ncbi:MAG: hypothetical protein V4473_02335 [Patescibacteria group bacterium]
MNINVRFYQNNGRLIRTVTVEGKTFREQFDWDGWYGYHSSTFTEITEERAISLVLSNLQMKHPDYKNPGKARFKLYDFNLLHLDRQLGAKIPNQKAL